MLALYLSVLDSEEDKDRFEELYNTYRQSMYKVAYSILHNREDAEDAVHEAFVCIANKFYIVNTLSVPKLKSYFVIIIRNTSLNIYRKNKKRCEMNENIEDTDIPFDVNFFDKMDYNAILNMIEQLPQINRDVLTLFYVHHIPVKEIAEMFGTSESVIYKRMNRGKKLLKELLEEGGSYV